MILTYAAVDVWVDGILVSHVPQDHPVAGPKVMGAEKGSSRQIAHTACELFPLRSTRRRAAFAELRTSVVSGRAVEPVRLVRVRRPPPVKPARRVVPRQPDAHICHKSVRK